MTMTTRSACAIVAAAALLGGLLAGCAAGERAAAPGAAQTPAAAAAPAGKGGAGDAGGAGGKAASSPGTASSPAPASAAAAAGSSPAAPGQPAPQAAQPAGAAPTPAPAAAHAAEQPAAAAKPAPAAAAQPAAGGKAAAPTAAADQDRKALSWYYMKKGAGKVPDFPKETHSFPPEQKAVWVGTGKKVYLTFDTGGPMGDTEKLLKTLKDNQVHANFFIAGYNLKKDPEFLKQLVADGHLVANHTMTHTDFNKLTDEQIKKEISDFEKLYKDITGKDVVKYFRFPYGAYNRHVLSLVSELGYTSVFWSTAMVDWEPRKNPDDPLNDIMANLHDGNVILMHQGSKENIDALDKIIKAIESKGYEFDTVDHLKPPPR